MPTPRGDAFRINQQVTGRQMDPYIMALPDGGYVVAWVELLSGMRLDENGRVIRVQRFDADGEPQGESVRLNEALFPSASDIDIVLGSDGFTVLWRVSGAGAPSIQARTFDFAGVPQGENVRLGDNLGIYTIADATGLADGGFVLMRHDFRSGNSMTLDRFDASGERIGGSLVYRPEGATRVLEPEIVALPDGGFILMWRVEDARGISLDMQRFDRGGAPIDERLTLVPFDRNATVGEEANLTLLPDGNSAVVWQGQGAIIVRVFDLTGAPQGSVVSFPFSSNQPLDDLVVAALPDGGFVLTWSTQGVGTLGFRINDIFVREFGPDGTPRSEIVPIGDLTGDQMQPSVTVLPDGDYIIVWGNSAASGDPDNTILARRFSPSGVQRPTEGDDVLVLTNGNDVLDALAGNDRIEGRDGNDRILGNDGNDVLDGGDGNDVLIGGRGEDRLEGGAGDDTLEGGDGTDVLVGGEGFDIAVFDHGFGEGALTVENGNIVVTGPRGRDVLTGIEALRFSDRTLTVSNLFIGTTGPDTLTGTGGDDVILGGGGADRLAGGAGDDWILGGSGDDTFDAGAGRDVIDGGEGRDRLFMAGTGGTLDLRLTGAQATGAGGQITVSGIEDVTGTGGTDVIVGDGGANDLDGGGGDDVIYGVDGDDVLTGGIGNDLLDGGSGFDTAIINGTRAGATVTYRDGAILVAGSDGTDTLVGIETIRFTDGVFDVGRDGRIADVGRQTLTGTTGDDTIRGGGSNDVLIGGSGRDLLIGGGGSDSLEGGDGFDAALYFGVRLQYFAALGFVLGGPEGGRDTLRDIEELRFVDGVLSFDIDGYAAQVMRLYNAAFDRLFDQSGLEAHVQNLAGGSLTLDALAQAFVGSAEFIGRYGSLSDQAFVEQLYRFCLNREGDPAGIAAQVQALLSGVSRGQLVINFSESVEHRQLTQSVLDVGLWVGDLDAQIIARLYQATFDRLPDAAGLAAQLAAYQGGLPLAQLAANFASSAEFQERYGALSNQQFVEQLYRFCLDREGDAEGIAAHVSVLDAGASRAQLLVNFSESAEHRALTASLWSGGIQTTDGPYVPEIERMATKDEAAQVLIGADVLPDKGEDVVQVNGGPGDLFEDDAFVLAPLEDDAQVPLILPDGFDGLNVDPQPFDRLNLQGEMPLWLADWGDTWLLPDGVWVRPDLGHDHMH